MKNTKEILIAGGGISGLVAAFELSEDPNLSITVVEATDACGGKMKGYFNPEKQRFEEHSIRALSSTYFSLFNVFERADLLHLLSPVDDYHFYESQSGEKVKVSRKDPMDIETVQSMIKTFGLNKKNMVQLVQRIVHHVNSSKEDREKLAYEKAGDILGVEDFDENTRQFIVNWFGILTGARMHSKAVDILDSFALMFLPMTDSPSLPKGEVSKSYCYNKPTSEVIQALVEKLEERGVKFQYNTRILNLHKSDKISIETNQKEFTDKIFDATVMAIPHESLWKMGLMNSAKKPMNDEWSFGTQFPMKEIPEEMKPFAGKSYNLCFDAPWNIVFQIQHQGSFWKEVEFPNDYPYNLSATCSSPFNKGKLFGKRFMECTPNEAKEEILFQLGITNVDERKELMKHAVIDPVNLKYTKDWEQYSSIETVEMGILQENNKRWVNFAQIYVRNAEEETISIQTDWNNIFLAGEIVEVKGRWKIPTMEQAATSGKQAAQAVFDFLKINKKVYLETSKVEEEGKYKVIDPLLSGLNKLLNIV